MTCINPYNDTFKTRNLNLDKLVRFADKLKSNHLAPSHEWPSYLISRQNFQGEVAAKKITDTTCPLNLHLE